MALLRNPSENSQQLSMNLSYVPSIIGAVIVGIGSLFMYSGLSPFRTHSLWIYSFAAIVELLTEPFYIYTQRQLLYQIRVWSEGTAFLCQCISTFAQFMYILQSGRGLNGIVSEEDGVIAHAYAQLCFSLVLGRQS
jgi:oligosaccharide translocation protein RFT1